MRYLQKVEGFCCFDDVVALGSDGHGTCCVHQSSSKSESSQRQKASAAAAGCGRSFCGPRTQLCTSLLHWHIRRGDRTIMGQIYINKGPPGAAAVGKCTLGQQYSRADEKKDPESDLHGALSGFCCNSFSRQNVDCKKLTSAMTLGPLCNFLLVFDSTSVFILAPS